jgi:hypothetical protein
MLQTIIQISNEKYDKTKIACFEFRKLRFAALRPFLIIIENTTKKKIIKKNRYVKTISMNSYMDFK